MAKKSKTKAVSKKKAVKRNTTSREHPLVKDNRETLRLMAMPIDFDALCAEGVLKRVGKGNKTFRIIDPKQLPKHVALQLQLKGEVATFDKQIAELAKRMLSKGSSNG